MRAVLFLSAALLAAAAPSSESFRSLSSRQANSAPVSRPAKGLFEPTSNAKDVTSEKPAGQEQPKFADQNTMIINAKEVTGAISNGSIPEKDVPSAVQNLFLAASPTATPVSVSDSMIKAKAAFEIKNASPTGNASEPNFMASALGLMMDGFVNDNVRNTVQNKDAVPVFANPPVPADKSFYTKEGNAPFSVPEELLRSAIQIPPTFSWGQKQPVLMCPGTGATGFETFSTTVGKLLATTDFADPVYLIIPGRLMDDVQINAEFVAYAIQYMNVMTNRNVAAVTWSQGSLDVQWALKYWPSTRNVVTDFIPLSPDFRGTRLAHLLCSAKTQRDMIACTPAVYQQTYNSHLISTLRRDGGDSAYVPTTTVYSQYDEVVQPQSGRGASGFIGDANGVGVSNNLLQEVCQGQEGAGGFLHEGVIYSATAYALIVDALTHDGPADIERVRGTCSQTTPPGVMDADVLQVEALMVVILFRLLTFTPKVSAEPPIKDYAA
ncbi:hypothetical protein Golomagni_02629 [Golovinomyces magnicellulatus]|nr:hypothetical protein Golomagni_02629 [Golovinomyces magnicellulatus]